MYRPSHILTAAAIVGLLWIAAAFAAGPAPVVTPAPGTAPAANTNSGVMSTAPTVGIGVPVPAGPGVNVPSASPGTDSTLPSDSSIRQPGGSPIPSASSDDRFRTPAPTPGNVAFPPTLTSPGTVPSGGPQPTTVPSGGAQPTTVGTGGPQPRTVPTGR
jgi:hypothetical protein